MKIMKGETKTCSICGNNCYIMSLVGASIKKNLDEQGWIEANWYCPVCGIKEA